jgi:hypothetical protein
MEREPQAQEPAPTSQAAASDEMTDEQLDQVAGGNTVEPLDFVRPRRVIDTSTGE